MNFGGQRSVKTHTHLEALKSGSPAWKLRLKKRALDRVQK
jgi:hypothetical protein